MNEKKNLQELINLNKILIVSKKTCKYCDLAKNALTEAGYTYMNIEIDLLPNILPNILEEAISISNQRTVPNIWINGVHIGGYDKLLNWIRENPRKLEFDDDF